MSKNAFKTQLLNLYDTKYFNNLEKDQKKQGNRFLISPCPKKKKDVEILFLNLNPQEAKKGEDPNIGEVGDSYWFDETVNGKPWRGSKHFRNLFYVIGEKLKNPKWSYQENHRSIKWNELTSDKIYSKPILSAYAYPSRTREESDLTDEQKEYAKNLWKEIIKLLPKPLKIIVTGKNSFEMICEILEIKDKNKYMIITTNLFYERKKIRYHKTIKWASMTDGTKILCFPQVTKFPIIGYTGDKIDKTNSQYTDYTEAIDTAFDFLLK